MADAISRLVRGPAPKADIGRYLARVELHAESVHLVMKRRALFTGDREAAADAEALTRRLAPGERLAIEAADPSLIRVILPVRLKTGGGRSRLASLTFLSPQIQAAIVAGRQPAGLKLEYLLRETLPLAWADQKAKFGF